MPTSNEQITDAFTQALQQADKTGSATVGFRNSSTEETGNESAETGYDITVVRIGGTRPAAQPTGTSPQPPSAGRIVLVAMDPTKNNGSTTAPAVVTRAWAGGSVNVRVLSDSSAAPEWRTSLTYAPDLDALDAADPTRPYRWTWPPRV